MNPEPIHFEGADGATLAARLDSPTVAPHAYALFAHCFTCSKESLAATRIAGALKERGIAVLRFDFTGLGDSHGEFANTSFSSNVGDLVAAADFLREKFAAPRLLIGHSLGGAAVLAAAAKIPEAKAIVTLGAPFDPAHVTKLFAPVRAEIDARGEAEVTIAGRTFLVRKQFLDDIARANNEHALGSLRKALLVMHSPRDTVVPIDNAAQIFMAARHPKSFVSLDDADHLVSRREDAEYIAGVIAAWATRYVGDAAPVPATAGPEGGVRVEELGSGPYANFVHAGSHLLRADEPESLGGGDTGPSPYQLLLASLGACTSMTLRMYADRKGWPLERVSVDLRHSKIHAKDCAECETREGTVDRIERVLHVEGKLDDDQRQRLLEIADRCPVHRTLHGEITIPTSLAE
ncbi:MAG: alpha/beta fold hydrolase [Betaproteobacteria bacterium]|nr:alpha/beta fold hydrolase [Betaproteobacteria bacterium]